MTNRCYFLVCCLPQFLHDDKVAKRVVVITIHCMSDDKMCQIRCLKYAFFAIFIPFQSRNYDFFYFLFKCTLLCITLYNSDFFTPSSRK